MANPHAHIVSHTEKRTRLRVVSRHRTSTDMDRFVAAVKQLPCVDNVRTNVRTGSILIDHQGGTRDQFKGVFEDIGCILRSTILPELPAGKTRLDLPQAVADLDVRLGLVGSPFRLSNVIPISLGAFAFFQMRRQGFQLSNTPWFVLAYLAYHTYTRLHKFDKVVEKIAQNPGR